MVSLGMSSVGRQDIAAKPVPSGKGLGSLDRCVLDEKSITKNCNIGPGKSPSESWYIIPSNGGIFPWTC